MLNRYDQKQHNVRRQAVLSAHIFYCEEKIL